MSTITTRAGKGSELTWAELDANFTALNTDKLQLDASGNLGIGSTSPGAKLHVDSGATALMGILNSTNANGGYITGQSSGVAVWDLGTAYQAFNTGTSTDVGLTTRSGFLGFGTASTERMRLDALGNLLVGTASNSETARARIMNLNSSEWGSPTLLLSDSSGTKTFSIYNGVVGYNAAQTVGQIAKHSTTSRSLNAAGTVNASGADYAEYEHNNGLKFTKGDVLGFKADGTLTKTYSEAVRFGIKSTNPAYVGGDTWGSEDAVGKLPEQPIRKFDKIEVRELAPEIPATEDEQIVEASFEIVVIEAGDTDAEWAETEAKYKAELDAFNEALEDARQLVDRIAYSGKVPCNVTGATPGGYIIAVDIAGVISGKFIADPDFNQYKKAVGRVNRILPDGRCEVVVIVH